MQRLLTEMVSLPEYRSAVEKAQGAWYRMDKTARKNHEFVDR